MFKDKEMKVSFLAGIGGMLEFYDFILYILFSDQIGRVFFSDIQSVALKQFIVVAIFSVAYLVRPIGGIFVGWMGDRIGRKRSFSFTIILMGVCVFLMGVMPGYQQIGLLAPLIFVFLRLVQGFALGGELPGAIVFVYESVQRKGKALGILFSMVFFGFLLGDLMSIVLRALFGSYAWRAAFISGALVAIVGYYIRQRLEETPLFSALEKKNKFPLLVLFKDHFWQVIGAICAVVVVAFNGVVLALYLPKYLISHVGYDVHTIELIFLITAFINILVVYLSSYATDRVNYIKLYRAMCVALVVLSYPVFVLMSLKSTIILFFSLIVIAVIVSVVSGLFMRIICDAFSTDVRFSGVAVGYNFAFALVGGFIPMVSEMLIQHASVAVGPAVSGMMCGLLGLLSTYILKRNKAGC